MSLIKKVIKPFLILILVGTIFGGIYGGIKSHNRQEKLRTAEVVYTAYNSSLKNTILAVENLKYSEEYLKAIKEKRKTLDVPLLSLNEGENLYIYIY